MEELATLLGILWKKRRQAHARQGLQASPSKGWGTTCGCSSSESCVLPTRSAALSLLPRTVDMLLAIFFRMLTFSSSNAARTC